MMTSPVTHWNTFEGLADGDVLTAGNSGGTSGDLFSGVVRSGAAAGVIDSGRVAHGSRSLEVTTGTGDTLALVWNVATRRAALRPYLWLDALPTEVTQLMVMRHGDGFAVRVDLWPDGRLRLNMRSDANPVATLAGPFPVGQWVRPELFMEQDTGVATGRASMGFAIGDGDLVQDTGLVPVNVVSTGDLLNLQVGKLSSGGGYHGWIDDVAANIYATGYIGPYAATYQEVAQAGPPITVRPGEVVTLTGVGTGTWEQDAADPVQVRLDPTGDPRAVVVRAPVRAAGATLNLRYGGSPTAVTVLPATDQYKGADGVWRPFVNVRPEAALPGNVEPPPDTTAPSEVDYTAFLYDGAWSTSIDATERYTNTAGATATTVATVPDGGGQVSILGVVNRERGIAGVRIDGGPEVLVDAYQDSASVVAPWYTTPVLTAGEHTITTRCTGTKRAASTGLFLSIEGATTTNGQLAAPEPEPTDPAPPAPPSAPTNVVAVESPEKATLVTWTDPQTDVVWFVRESRDPDKALNTDGLTERRRQSGSWLFPGQDYSYSVQAMRLSDGALSEWSAWSPVLTLAGGTTPDPEPEPTDPGPQPVNLNAVQEFVLEARAYYPGADPELGHLPQMVYPDSLMRVPRSAGGVPLVYWVGRYSEWEPGPDDEPGYVHRSDDYFSYSRSSALAEYVGPERAAWVDCRHHTFLNVPRGQEPGNDFRAVVFLGLNPEITKWMGDDPNTITLYRTKADADAQRNGIAGPRPGTWFVSQYASNPKIDDALNHRQSVKAVAGGSLNATTELKFRAFEGTSQTGDYAGEFQWTIGASGVDGGPRHRLVTSGHYVQRTSVWMQPSSSAKLQGDARHFFGGLRQLVSIGATVDSTAYQSFFNQMTQANTRPELLVVRYDNTNPTLAVEKNGDTNYYNGGGSSGPWQFLSPNPEFEPQMRYDVTDVYVYRPGASRSQLVAGAPHPGVTVGYAPGGNFIDPALVGRNYLSPEQA